MNLTPAQKKALKTLSKAHKHGHDWVNYGNRTYPIPVVRLLQEKQLIVATGNRIKLTKLGSETVQELEAQK